MSRLRQQRPYQERQGDGWATVWGEGKGSGPEEPTRAPAPPGPPSPGPFGFRARRVRVAGPQRGTGEVRGEPQVAAPPWALHPVAQEFPGRRDVAVAPCLWLWNPRRQEAARRERARRCGAERVRSRKGAEHTEVQESFPPGLSPPRSTLSGSLGDGAASGPGELRSQEGRRPQKGRAESGKGAVGSAEAHSWSPRRGG